MSQEPDPFVITIDGKLDARTARRMAQRILGSGLKRGVIIDFVHGTERDLVSLSVVAEAIARRGTPVTIRGVCQRDLRILRCLGVALSGEPGAQTIQ